jgi:hypothetical protein
MATIQHAQKTIKFEIQTYRPPKDRKTLRTTHVAFSGSPQRHPYDANNKDDIAYVEELPNIVNLDGDTITMVRVWIKKMSIGMRCSPFIVEDTAGEPRATIL